MSASECFWDEDPLPTPSSPGTYKAPRHVAPRDRRLGEPVSGKTMKAIASGVQDRRAPTRDIARQIVQRGVITPEGA
jgi:hypothetical protein